MCTIKEIEVCIRECLKYFTEDYPIMHPYLNKLKEVQKVQRVDRRNRRQKDVYVLIFEEAPLGLSKIGGRIKCILQSCIKGYLMAKLNIESSAKVIIQTRDLVESLPSGENYRFISLDEALRMRLIEDSSPYVEYMQKYEISSLEIMKDHIVGPDIGAIEIIEKTLARIKFKRMFDLFTGTGALIKVGLMNGVEYAIGFDLNIELARKTLSDFSQKVNLIEGNVFQSNLSMVGNFVVADPNMDISHDFILKIVPKIIDKVELLLLIHGHTEYIEWNRKIRKELSRIFNYILPVHSWAMECSLATNNLNIYNSLKDVFSYE